MARTITAEARKGEPRCPGEQFVFHPCTCFDRVCIDGVAVARGLDFMGVVCARLAGKKPPGTTDHWCDACVLMPRDHFGYTGGRQQVLTPVASPGSKRAKSGLDVQ